MFLFLCFVRNACSNRVACLLRGAGNSISNIQKQISVQHSETWLKKCSVYIHTVAPFGSPESPPEMPPAYLPPPEAGWFSQVYIKDVLQRTDEIKAQLTSVYGTVLKMSSTKKVHNYMPFNYVLHGIL